MKTQFQRHFDAAKRQRISRLSISTLAAACAAIFAANHASAQQQEQQEVAPEQVIVTGSRVRGSTFTTPTPVMSVTAEELEFMAPGNMIESLTQLPIFFNNTTQDAPGNFFNTPGSGSLNIRGLNTNRTLTLLNGRRMTPTNRVGSVDVNAFPEVLVERVEVVTGGASAAYGADAVAGVANFILNTDFNGFETHAQTGDSTSDRSVWEFGAVWGKEIGERGHLIASFERYGQDALTGWTNRGWYQSYGQIRTAPSFDTIAPNVVAYVGSQDGVLSASGVTCNPTNPAPGCIDPITFDASGNPVPFTFGSPLGGGAHSITNGGSGTPNGAERATLSPRATRESAFLYYDIDLNDRTNLYGQYVYGENTSLNNNLGGTFTLANTVTIFSGNAFLPASVQQIMDDNALASMSFTRIGSDADLAFGAQQHTRNTSRTFTLGLDHDIEAEGFFDGWQFRSYIQRGSTEHRGNHINGIRIDRLPAALDAVIDPATNEPACFAALADPANWGDCVPINLFGQGNASQEALDWVRGLDAGTPVRTPVFFTDGGVNDNFILDYVSGENKLTLTTVDQQILEFTLDGEVGEGWAGPITAAFGVHHRSVDILQLTFDHTNPTGAFDSRPALFDPAIVRGIPPGMSARTTAIQFASVPNLIGGSEVDEAFAEFIIPLIDGQPAAESLTATVAARWIDYSITGDIQAWKAGLDWEINDLLRLRSTVSRDIREPNWSERLDRTGGITNVFDPMFNEIRPTSRAQGGNPNLNPEEADTRTIGLVFQPTEIPGFQASVDWYEIDLTGAVGQIGAQNIVDECWNIPTSSLCNLMRRESTDGTITIIEDVFINIDAAKASGVDFETAYSTDLGPGRLNWRFVASQLNENSITNLGAPKVERAGDVGTLQLPDFKATTSLTYRQGPITAFVQARYIAAGLLDSRDVEGVTISDNSVDSVLYTDARVSYGRDLSSGARWEVFGAVTNLFDEDPPIVAGFSAFSLQTSQANLSLHDVLGRRYTFGFRYEL
jgi:outer membrane receptor protein involved in Fe transport